MVISSWRYAASALLLAGSSLAGTTACVEISATDAQYVEREEKRFTVSGTPDLTLGTFDGNIEVRTWDRPEVLVVAEKRGFDHDALEGIRLDAEHHDDVISVNARHEGARTVVFGFGRGVSVSLKVTVPIATTVRATTGDGLIDIRDVRGSLSADTGDGSITLQDVSGDVDVQSGDGRIRVDGKVTRVRARSGDGSVAIHAYPGSEAAEDWTITTGDGAIVLEVPSDLRADLDAQTADGRVITRDLPVSDQERADDDSERRRERNRRTFRASVNGGGPRIRLRSGDGSITVRGS